MPTRAQLDELRENCTREWTQQNGVNGIRLTGPNGNSIFLPAAGGRQFDYLYDDGSYGYFWSSSLYQDDEYCAYHLYFTSYNWDWYDNPRYCGNSVRAVITPEKPHGSFSCPDSNHPHMIDLGLSSGTKWSCCNIDATNPV